METEMHRNLAPAHGKQYVYGPQGLNLAREHHFAASCAHSTFSRDNEAGEESSPNSHQKYAEMGAPRSQIHFAPVYEVQRMYKAEVDEIPHVLLCPLFYGEQELGKQASNETHCSAPQKNNEPSWRDAKASNNCTGSSYWMSTWGRPESPEIVSNLKKETN